MPDGTTKVPRTGAAGRRGEETRNAILAVAERLFAEQGVCAVSNRQISEAAGQGNNTAVGYHFGSKAELVRAIVRKHQGDIGERRLETLAAIGDSTDVRDWVDALVRPSVEHLGTLDGPTWYARCIAQVMTDPVMRESVIDEAFDPSTRQALDGLNRCLPALPLPVRLERGHMARHLIVHTLAAREQALAGGLAPGVHTTRTFWNDAATGLVDALVGLWLAPVTRYAAHERP